MYLLDTNVFITGRRDYYPDDRVPEYWDWIVYQAKSGKIKIPPQIYDEIQKQQDDLATWVKSNKDDLVIRQVDLDIKVPDVLNCYSPNLTESEIEQLRADPFLVAAGLKTGFAVVSKENSRPSAQGVNKKVPDICKTLGVRCINDYKLIRELDFKTSWKIHP